MTTTNTADNFAAIIDRLSEKLEQLRGELEMQKQVLVDTPFVVRVGGLFLGFEYAADNSVSAKVVMNVRDAVKFSRGRAAEIAATTRNGNGDCGEVITIIAALEGQIASLEQSLAMLA